MQKSAELRRCIEKHLMHALEQSKMPETLTPALTMAINTASGSENEKLRRRVAELEQENATLRAKVTFFDRTPWMHDGMRIEQIVAELVGGTTTPVNERFDVLTRGGVRIEVKYSNLNLVDRQRARATRWTWAHILGFDGGKSFDHLILVGDADTRYRASYRDPESPFVFFDVPFCSLQEVVRSTSQMVQITTNPDSVRAAEAIALFERFQVTPDELTIKYGAQA